MGSIEALSAQKLHLHDSVLKNNSRSFPMGRLQSVKFLKTEVVDKAGNLLKLINDENL